MTGAGGAATEEEEEETKNGDENLDIASVDNVNFVGEETDKNRSH